MIRGTLRQLCYAAGYGALGAAAALVAFYAWHLTTLPALNVWHTARLDAEFRASDTHAVRTLADYRALEGRLLAQLKMEVYERVRPEDRFRHNRYAAGSLSDPLRQPVNWNLTFELAPAKPRGGVLLLHGMSDSPYSMRALAEHLHARGYLVVGLRLPGHGTAPSGLLHASWEDMAAAVRLAARDLARRLGPGSTLDMVGYSTGAALAVEYALARAQGEDIPQVNRLVLISPAIGVSPAAALAVWQARLAELLGVTRLAWTDVLPEYDPYKYSSFTVNAAQQVYAITRTIAARMAALEKSGTVSELPRTLAFQSVADDTVSTPALVEALLRRLAPAGHELVLFDINRHSDAAALYRPGVPDIGARLLEGPALPFDLTLVTNTGTDTAELSLLRRHAGPSGLQREPARMKWPADVFSLSHVALPFSPTDPVYGAVPPRPGGTIYLGRPLLLGERGLLAVSPGNLMRLRHNPFFDYLQARVDAFMLEAR